MKRISILAALLSGVLITPVHALGSCGSTPVGNSPGPGNLYGGGASDESINGLDPEFQSNLSRLIADANERFGGTMSIYSGYRSPERQAELWAEALERYGSEAEARKWVAPPGNSQHNRGMAADMAWNGQTIHYGSPISDWLSANLGNYGLTRPLSNEGWHIEPIGARGGTGAGSGSGAGAGSNPGGAGEPCSGDTVQDLPEVFLMPWVSAYPVAPIMPGTY